MAPCVDCVSVIFYFNAGHSVAPSDGASGGSSDGRGNDGQGESDPGGGGSHGASQAPPPGGSSSSSSGSGNEDDDDPNKRPRKPIDRKSMSDDVPYAEETQNQDDNGKLTTGSFKPPPATFDKGKMVTPEFLPLAELSYSSDPLSDQNRRQGGGHGLSLATSPWSSTHLSSFKSYDRSGQCMLEEDVPRLPVMDHPTPDDHHQVLSAASIGEEHLTLLSTSVDSDTVSDSMMNTVTDTSTGGTPLNSVGIKYVKLLDILQHH